jgi:hypothetical protein
MKIQIGESGIGGRDEHWWYLGFDEVKGTFYIEHEWDYSGWNNSDRGTEALSLSEAKERWPERYKDVVKLFQQKLFTTK